MPLYTFSMEFGGGAYLSQVKASSPHRAVRLWSKTLDFRVIVGLGLKGKLRLIERIENDRPVAVLGLRNVWCVSAHVSGKLALVTLCRPMRDSGGGCLLEGWRGCPWP